MAVTEDVMRRGERRGATLVEVLVVVGILAALAGLLLGAVQRVRAEANRVKSLNRLRQIGIATQNYCAANHGTLPCGPFIALLAYLEADNALTYPHPRTDSDIATGDNHPFVLAYQSPADPTLGATISPGNTPGSASYASNSRVFPRIVDCNAVRIEASSDGAAYTIAYGERFAQCGRTAVVWSLGVGTCFDTSDGSLKVVQCANQPARGPTFADTWIDDVMPVTVGGITAPSTPGVTFQVRPTAEQCDYRQLQTPHPGGMLTAYLDGSVRTMSPTVTPAVFWSAVTPAGGEVTPPE